MTALTDVLTEHCFEPDPDGRWFTNRHQFVRLSPAGTWQVFQLVAEGRTAAALREKAHHPRWLDEEGFVIHPPMERK